MKRRDILKNLAAGAGATLLTSGFTESFARSRPKTAPGTSPATIKDVKVILTAPHKIRLVVVKVITSEPGLYGVGCATFTQRARVVQTAIDRFLKPFLLG